MSLTEPTKTEPTATVPTSTVDSHVAATSTEPTTDSAQARPATGLPDVELAGVNDPHCHSPHPPVVLLHGTVSTPKSNFTPLAAALRSSGRCVYAVLYGAMFGWGGIGDIDASADQVGKFVDRVRRLTHAEQVDVVAFSQGALVLRDALQRSLEPKTVRLAVLLAPNYHGTSVNLVSKVPATVCASCAEQAAGSPLLRRLAKGGELAPGVRYASLSTRSDTWVLPVASQAPRGPADRVRSQLLQDACPEVVPSHIDLPATPSAIAWVLAALDTDGRPPSTFACS